MLLRPAIGLLIGRPSIAVLALAFAVGCGGGDREGRAPQEAEGPQAASEPRPRATLILRNLREESLTVVDAQTGEASVHPVPELAPGDAPYQLILTGGRLVFYGDGPATFALDPGLKEPARSLGESWYFVPSATDGRVWLAILDPASPETIRDLRAVREVTIDGRVTVPDSGPPPCRGPTVIAAVEDGVLCQDDGLVVWDPATGRVRMRLPGPFPAATHANLVAWCEHRCPSLHLTNVRTGEGEVVSPGADFAFEETYDGAFSPDGSLLAVPVLIGDHHGVALVDVGARTAELVPGSRFDGDYRALAWSSGGDWLFFSAGEGWIMAYRPGAQTAVLVAVVESAFIDMVAR